MTSAWLTAIGFLLSHVVSLKMPFLSIKKVPSSRVVSTVGTKRRCEQSRTDSHSLVVKEFLRGVDGDGDGTVVDQRLHQLLFFSHAPAERVDFGHSLSLRVAAPARLHKHRHSMNQRPHGPF